MRYAGLDKSIEIFENFKNNDLKTAQEKGVDFSVIYDWENRLASLESSACFFMVEGNLMWMREEFDKDNYDGAYKWFVSAVVMMNKYGEKISPVIKEQRIEEMKKYGNYFKLRGYEVPVKAGGELEIPAELGTPEEATAGAETPEQKMQNMRDRFLDETSEKYLGFKEALPDLTFGAMQ